MPATFFLPSVAVCYFGPGKRSTGDWCFEDGFITFRDIAELYIKHFRGRVLSIHSDCSYAGQDGAMTLLMTSRNGCRGTMVHHSYCTTNLFCTIVFIVCTYMYILLRNEPCLIPDWFRITRVCTGREHCSMLKNLLQLLLSNTSNYYDPIMCHRSMQRQLLL